MEPFARMRRWYSSKELRKREYLDRILEEGRRECLVWKPFCQQRLQVVEESMGQESPRVARLRDFLGDVVRMSEDLPRQRDGQQALAKLKNKQVAEKGRKMAADVRDAVARFRKQEKQLFEECLFRVKLDLDMVRDTLSRRRSSSGRVRDWMVQVEEILRVVRDRVDSLDGPTEDCWRMLRAAHQYNRAALIHGAMMTEMTLLEQYLGRKLSIITPPFRP